MSDRRPRPTKPVEPVKTGWVLAGRLGSPSEPHVLAVLATRYEALGKSMELSRAAVQRVEQIPGGRPMELIEQLAKANDATRSTRRSAGVHLMLDVTRSPEARHLAFERLPDVQVVLIVKGVRADWSLPYRLLGRLTLMSGMSALMARQQLAVTVRDSEDGRRFTLAKVREVLAKAQARPPTLDDEELALGGSVDDDAALVMALGAWVAHEEIPSPWRED